MTQRQRRLRWWVGGYVAALFGLLPAALPCWNGWARDVLGRFVTIEMIHVGQYLGLGWLAASYAWAGEDPFRTWTGLGPLVAGVGLVDEIVQGYLPQRVFQWSDVLFNWMGIALGVAGAGALRGLRRNGRRIEVGQRR